MSALDGITKADCPNACSINGCVVGLGHPVCCHPAKSGLPNNLLNDLAIQASYDAACTVLGVRNIHKVPTGETIS